MLNKRKLIARKIKEARLELNITQQDLANKLNFQNRSTISRIESGKTPINAEQIGDFSRILNKDIIYFLSDI